MASACEPVRPSDPVAQLLAQEPEEEKKSLIKMNKQQKSQVQEFNDARRIDEAALPYQEREVESCLRRWAQETDKGREISSQIERDMHTRSEYNNPPNLCQAQLHYSDACARVAEYESIFESMQLLHERELPRVVYARKRDVGPRPSWSTLEDDCIKYEYLESICVAIRQAKEASQKAFHELKRVVKIHATRDQWLKDNQGGYASRDTPLAERFVDDGTPQAKKVNDWRKMVEDTKKSIQFNIDEAKKLRAKFHRENKANGGAPPDEPKAKRARKTFATGGSSE